MQRIHKLLEKLATFMLWVSVGALLLMASLVCLSSFMRYAIARPFGFTEELVALLYMAMVFLSLPIVTIARRHVRVTVLPERITTKYERSLAIVGEIIMSVFCIWFTLESYNFVQQSLLYGSTSDQANLVLWPWMALIPITVGFVSFTSLLHFAMLFLNQQFPAVHTGGSSLGEPL